MIGRGEILYNGSLNAIKEKYGSSKTITIQFAKPYETIELDGYETVSHDKNVAVLKNNENTVFHAPDFLSAISKKYEIADFSVESLSVDEILANLYKDYKL